MNGLVRCPICADEYRWPDEPEIAVFNEETQDYDFVNVAAMPPDKRADLARGGYRLCPNPSQDTPPHFLPATFADYGPPIVIGLVGAAHSGKTHLLTAMIRQAYLNGLSPYGVTVTALDFRRHENFRKQFVETFERGGELAGTDVGVIEAADILLLRGPGGERPVAFFDVAGEDLESTNARNRATRFLVGATAVIFVHASEDAIDTGRSVAASENQSFQLAVARLRDRGLPAAIAVAKSDRLRFVPPADRWLNRGDEQALDADRIRAESRDVYAYLHHTGAGASLHPYEAFPRCTLHFVSASGGDAVRYETPDGQVRGRFPHGFRPIRVLEPLVAILAMTGMLTDDQAKKVGTP
ncbi:hypothetical protein GCM10023148_18630 [Actinokineospora soli]